MIDNKTSKRPIETLTDADKVITDLRKENKNLRRQRNDLQALVGTLTQRCDELMRQLAAK